MRLIAILLLAASLRADQTGLWAAKGRFGDTGVMELTALIGYYLMMACVLTTAGLEPRAGAPALKM